MLLGSEVQEGKDGIYRLVNGDYTYTVRADGYTSVKDVAFTVSGEDRRMKFPWLFGTHPFILHCGETAPMARALSIPLGQEL